MKRKQKEDSKRRAKRKRLLEDLERKWKSLKDQWRVLLQKKSSDVGAPYPGCREAIRESYKRRGLAEDCIPVLLASLSDNTIKQYNASLQKWWTFCSEDNLDVFNSDSKLV
ncbi:unnamed protein product, partial [Callosobruchus maculatus]